GGLDEQVHIAPVFFLCGGLAMMGHMVRQEAVAKSPNGRSYAVDPLLFRRVAASGYVHQKLPRPLPGFVRGHDAMLGDGHAPGPSAAPVLDHIGLLARREDPETEPGHLII